MTAHASIVFLALISTTNKAQNPKYVWYYQPGFYFAISNIKASLQSWDENPVLTTIDSASVPIKNLQFPTITICPG